jgi:hypothetical protein
MPKQHRKNWFLRRLALGLVVAAVAAPVAQARVDEGATAQRVVCMPKWGCQSLDAVNSTQVGNPGASVERSVGARHRALGELNLTSSQDKGSPNVSPVKGVNTPSAVDWSDAGLGAGMAFALVLLGAGALVATRRVRHHATV